MRFPLGKAIFVLGILAVASGVAVWQRPATPRSDLVVWCFADSHARTFRDSLPGADGKLEPPLIEQFRQRTGLSVRVELVSSRAEDVRLASLFMSGARGEELPDLCEIEIGSIGQFLRGPVDAVGFLPLNDFLAQGDRSREILASRLAPWSKVDSRTGRQIVFGIPNDVHPMTITYRKDLFDEAGIDPQSAATWPEFQDQCLRLQEYRKAHGHPESRAMLLQRHINVIDSSDRVHLSDENVAQTVAFYGELVSGPRAISADSGTDVLVAHDLAAGNVCAMMTPDWRAGDLRQYAPQLAGKLRMMPLPRFEDGDAPTSTWGGTMMGIPRECQNPQQAQELLDFLYLSDAGNAARLAAGSEILPPVPRLWSDPAYHQADPFFGGQKIGELYAALAQQIPQREVTANTIQAEIALSLVLHRAEAYVDSHGSDGLKDACAGWLAEAQKETQRRIDFGKMVP
jgi:arabinosaccharide transport system substrate-binding protein